MFSGLRTTMDRHLYLDETSHVIFLGIFENNKKCKEKILQEIKVTVCAMLNSNGGKVIIHLDTDSSIPVEGIPFSRISTVIRILEQSIISIIGLKQTITKVNFRDDRDSVIIFVKKADSLITMNNNLYLPSQTQVVEVSPSEGPVENVKDIIFREVIPDPVKIGSPCQILCKNEKCGFHESKICQFKNVKADQSKRTALADRITGKGNKLSCYVSAFANLSGGHICYGITDEGVIKGETIPAEKDKNKITEKVEKALNKMIWPEQIGQPKRGEHWEIFFEPVLDANFEPVPTTFVIVIYIAPCLGGVFTAVPECYEMVKGEVKKMSFTDWKKGVSRPVWLRSKEQIAPLVQRSICSSAARKAFTVGGEKLRQLINNGDWDAFSKECVNLQRSSKPHEMKLVVLYKQVISCCRRGHLHEASAYLKEYMDILPQGKDHLFFEVLGLYLKAAWKRASKDFKGLKDLLTEAVSKAEYIEPGLLAATVYVFAATVTDLMNLNDPTRTFLPDALSIKALEHLQYVPEESAIRAEMEQKVHITLATFYLGCNINGDLIKNYVDTNDIDKAKTSITAVHNTADEGTPLSGYREVQFHLVRSIYNYQQSKVKSDQKIRLLRSAFTYAKKAESLAKDYQFTEMFEWSKANQALCTEELVRANLGGQRRDQIMDCTTPNSETNI